MIIRRVHYSTLILIEILILIKSISTCPIPFDIQSKCRCAITETGRVYIYCARKQLNVIPHFNNSKLFFKTIKDMKDLLFFPIKATLSLMNWSSQAIEYHRLRKIHLMV